MSESELWSFYRLYKMLVGNTSIQNKNILGNIKDNLKLAQKFLKHFEMFYGKKIKCFKIFVLGAFSIIGFEPQWSNT